MPAVALLSCSDLVTPSTHLMLGNAYDPVNDCLAPQQDFDVVDGPAPSGTCSIVCIDDARTGTAYVTNMCPPYPSADTVETGEGGPDPCTSALAAWALGNECGATTDASLPEGSAEAASEAATPDATSAATDGGRDARSE